MKEINAYIFEGIYLMKQLYDHERGRGVFEAYRDETIEEDDFYEISYEACFAVIQDTRQYYNQEQEMEIYVFFDPVITEVFALCREYEKAQGITPAENPYRADIERAVFHEMSFSGYDYNVRLYDDASRGGCRLVLLLGCEFYEHYAIPGGLLDLCDSFCDLAERIKGELSRANRKMIPLPQIAAETERRAA